MRRVVIAWVLLVVGIVCLSQQWGAFYQSRDSNYNQNIVGGGCSTPTWYQSTFGASSQVASGTFLTGSNSPTKFMLAFEFNP
jgi:hypothetical protein